MVKKYHNPVVIDESILERLATKHDLAGLANKQDLVGLASKQDLVELATKQDLVGLATKQDLVGLAGKQDIVELKQEMALEMTSMKHDLRSEIYQLEIRAERGFKDNLKWVVTAMLAISSVIVAAFKLL